MTIHLGRVWVEIYLHLSHAPVCHFPGQLFFHMHNRGYGLEGPGLVSPQGLDIPDPSIPAPMGTRPRVQCVQDFLPAVKRSGREGNHSHPTSDEIKNGYNYIFIAPYTFMARTKKILINFVYVEFELICCNALKNTNKNKVNTIASVKTKTDAQEKQLQTIFVSPIAIIIQATIIITTNILRYSRFVCM